MGFSRQEYWSGVSLPSPFRILVCPKYHQQWRIFFCLMNNGTMWQFSIYNCFHFIYTLNSCVFSLFCSRNIFWSVVSHIWASQVVLEEKNLLVNAGDVRHVGSIPGSGRSPGGGHGNPLQYSGLENPMDRGAWQAPVCGVTKSQIHDWATFTLTFSARKYHSSLFVLFSMAFELSILRLWTLLMGENSLMNSSSSR